MVAEMEVIQHVQFACVDVAAEAVAADLAAAVSHLDLRSPDVTVPQISTEYLPTIRSGSFCDIGRRRYMEDEHIRIDDLSSHLGSVFTFPAPSAFYGVFDGHEGADAAAYMKRHAIRLLFEESDFPCSSQADDVYIESVERSVRSAFLNADRALADEPSVSSSSGTTALTAFVFGRFLVIANAGDCRAVLSRRGTAMDLSQDHRTSHPLERQHVLSSGGVIYDGYLNGILSVTRALGDWDLKSPSNVTSSDVNSIPDSPLIADPEFQHLILGEEDEFLIIGCDGIWDALTSQQAVGIVRQGLRRHEDPDRCARELVNAALCKSVDNLTVIVVCFGSVDGFGGSPVRLSGCKSLSVEAMCKLRRLLEE
ncbi:hypothetical protein LUZ60_003459 [Juncus effusus]|nr:hypothetical protein LUZ60_003459 [Juncus effusus]